MEVYTCEWGQTAAGKSIHLIFTRSAMLTWATNTFVDVRLATNTCEKNRNLKKTLTCQQHTMRSIQFSDCSVLFLTSSLVKPHEIEMGPARSEAKQSYV